MRGNTWLRATTLALAFVHTFPARRHVAALLASPSWTEGWKGVGACVAIALYLLPVSVQARGLQRLWRSRAGVLRAAGVVLAVAHVVPAADHVPRFLASPSFADGWRGLGAIVAVVWFALPLPVQARAIGALTRAVRLRLPVASRVLGARP